MIIDYIRVHLPSVLSEANNRLYKWNGEVFHYFDHLKVFYKSTGEIVSAYDKMCKVLNNYSRSF